MLKLGPARAPISDSRPPVVALRMSSRFSRAATSSYGLSPTVLAADRAGEPGRGRRGEAAAEDPDQQVNKLSAYERDESANRTEGLGWHCECFQIYPERRRNSS